MSKPTFGRGRCMSKIFFQAESVQAEITKYIHRLNDINYQEEYELTRRQHLKNILLSLKNNPDLWDEKTPVNRKHLSDNFLHTLDNPDINDEEVEELTAMCFRFYLERDINTAGELPRELRAFNNFVIYNREKFSERMQGQILYALHEMPVLIVKDLMHSSALQKYKDFPGLVDKAEQLTSEWKIKLEEKISEVNNLKAALDKHEAAFNFVGLYAGFSKLGKIKAQEYKWAKWTMLLLGVALLIPLVVEVFYLFRMPANTSINLTHFIKSIPILSLMLILVYYFRISLVNYNSVRAQVMQIELRKSLCRFIQSYAEYSKEIKSNNGDILEKFENVIFSNIMVSEEKIPSTYDGLEQVANLIKSIKS